MNITNRNEVIEILRRHKSLFAERYGVTELGIFGSIARGETTPESDVDVVVQMREPNLFFMVHIKDALEEAFHQHVDIIQYREKMNPFLKQRIDRDAMYV